MKLFHSYRKIDAGDANTDFSGPLSTVLACFATQVTLVPAKTLVAGLGC